MWSIEREIQPAVSTEIVLSVNALAPPSISSMEWDQNMLEIEQIVGVNDYDNSIEYFFLRILPTSHDSRHNNVHCLHFWHRASKELGKRDGLLCAPYLLLRATLTVLHQCELSDQSLTPFVPTIAAFPKLALVSERLSSSKTI
jgi:hypothetical protein